MTSRLGEAVVMETGVPEPPGGGDRVERARYSRSAQGQGVDGDLPASGLLGCLSGLSENLWGRQRRPLKPLHLGSHDARGLFSHSLVL